MPTISFTEILSYLQPLVFGALAWAWKLDGRLVALAAKLTADLADAKAEHQRDLHTLERALRAETVPMDEFRKLEQRIEKRLDRYETKLDEALDLIRKMAPSRT